MNIQTLNGLRPLLRKHNYENEFKETKVEVLMEKFQDTPFDLDEFTFDRLEGVEITDEVLEQVLDNTIETLSSALENIKQGCHPFTGQPMEF